MLFLLVIEALSTLIRKADKWLLLQPLGGTVIADLSSLFVDDLVLFLSPVAQDLQLAHRIFIYSKACLGLDATCRNVRWPQFDAMST
jgi:hypothetical protein